ncbi:hypothetical protein [Paenibacillus sp. 1P07SE]|uniref:hypothetical protein n=1 Tax=Paenibacillus sp. 1P07SE TaxID=3132209 RepID=UPI0039A40D58
MKRIRKSGAAGIMLAAILLAAGCSHSGMGHVTVGESGGTTTKEQGSVTYTSKDGEETTYSSKEELPEGFPGDIPFPPDYVVTSSITTEEGYTVTFDSTRPFGEVVELYKEYAERAGYQESYLMDEADFYNYTGNKGDEKFVSTLTLDLEDNKTVTGIIVYGKGRG